MKNIDTIDMFLDKHLAHGSNLYSTGTHLINYSTCIGQWDNGNLIINETKYNHTTSKNQNYLKRKSSNFVNKIIYVNDIPMNCKCLTKI